MTVQNNFVVTELHSSDWSILKQIRLEAVKVASGFLSTSYEKEVRKTDIDWQCYLEDPKTKYFAILNHTKPVALAVLKENKDNIEEAFLTSLYVTPAYRNSGLAKTLYEKRLQVAKENGYRACLCSTRQDNITLQKLCQSFGFVATHEVDYTWPDGTQLPKRYFRKILN